VFYRWMEASLSLISSPSNGSEAEKTREPATKTTSACACCHLLKAEHPYLHIYLVIDNERTTFDELNLQYTNSWSFCLCVSLERLATLVLSIPEGVVERRTSVHPVCAFTSIGRDCVGCFIGMWKGDCLGSSSRGQPRGALPLHQVTQRQFIKFADPTRRSGHNNLLHVLHRRVRIIW
jgi:hypothetical protein